MVGLVLKRQIPAMQPALPERSVCARLEKRDLICDGIA
jgi:hypothetical protein